MRAAYILRLALVLCVATAASRGSSAPAAPFTISSPSPAAASAGSGDLNVTLAVQQNTTTTFQQQYGLCLYTGVPSTPVARAASSTASNPTFTVPAGDFDIPTGIFSSGQYTAYLNLQTPGTACSQSSSISNSIQFVVSYPTLSSVSLAALAQPNSGSGYASYPASVEITGTNLNVGSGASFVFSSGAAGTTPTFQPGRYLPATGSVVIPVPALNEAGANGVLLSVCNTSTHYRYCSATTSLGSFALAATSTQLTSSIASPLVGQATMLTARITPGAGSTTAGGIYVPSIPSGAITFADGTTTLGTAPLLATSLTFGTTTRQTINASATVSSELGARARARRSVHPNATPSPDNSTSFTSIVADFNLDGAKDALILDQEAGKFHLLLGSSPAGNFQTEKIFASGCQYLSGATVADLNGDGYPDIAYLCVNNDNSSSLFALYNLGDGTFGPPASLRNTDGGSLIQAGSQIGSGDLNRDGKMDLVVTGTTSVSGEGSTYGIQTFLGDGAGHFTAGPVTVTPADPGTQLVVADLNNDGALDLVLLSSSYQTYTTVVQPYLNNGSGSFSTPASIPVCNCYTYTAKLFVAPLTANVSYPEITVANPDSQQVLVSLNPRTATSIFGAPVVTTVAGLTDAVLGDLNGDGLNDLAVFDGTSISVLNGDGLGGFAAQATSPNFASTGYSTANVSLVAATDFNQDGYADLLTIYPGPTFTSTINTYLTTGSTVASLPATFTSPGSHPLATTYLGNANVLGSSGALSLTVQSLQPLVPVLTFSPPALALSYGMPLPASLFNATVTAPGGLAIAGAITYNHAVGDVLNAGSQTLTATFTPADLHTYTVVSVSRTLTVQPASPIITFVPNPSTIVYGTAISAAQRNATVTSTYIAVVPGTFNYTFAPALTTIPGVGLTTITATFTPTDAIDFTTAASTATVTVTKATPTISFPIAPTAIVGTPLANLQLSPTVTGVTGGTLPGTVTFLPNTGLVVSGAQVLTVTFTPTDSADYNPVITTVSLNGTPLRLTALSSSSAVLGDPAKTITLTGTGFSTDSVVRANGTSLTTTYVSPTSLSAVVPAVNFLAVQTIQITVFNPTQNQTTAALPLTVSPASVGAITFKGPTSAGSGDQPTVQFTLTNPYPVSLTATLSLSFSPISGGVDDPAIQFKDGGRAFRFDLAAGQTVSPTIQLQSGTVAGTIQITLALFITDGGANVTPTSTTPLIITIPPAAPVITSTTVTRTGRQFTVNTYGLANTRAIGQAIFHFTAAPGKQIQTQDFTLDVTSLFSGWYSQAISATYGSTFLYTQTFTLDDDATVVGQVTVTLSNGVGVSASGSSE